MAADNELKEVLFGLRRPKTVILSRYSRLPMTRTLNGNRKKFDLSGVRSKYLNGWEGNARPCTHTSIQGQQEIKNDILKKGIKQQSLINTGWTINLNWVTKKSKEQDSTIKSIVLDFSFPASRDLFSPGIRRTVSFPPVAAI